MRGTVLVSGNYHNQITNWQQILGLARPKVEARLHKHLQTHDGKTDLLFINRRGRPYSANKLRAKILHPLLVKLGIPQGGFHSMRHGAASATLADGATPAVVQKHYGTVTHGLRWESMRT